MTYAIVTAEGDTFFVEISHPDYDAGGVIRVTGYRHEEGAQEGAAWWETFLTETPPEELVDVSGARFERSVA